MIQVKGLVALLCLVALADLAMCNNLLIGSTTRSVAYETRVEVPPVMFGKQERNIFYAIPSNQAGIITGIAVTDNLNSYAEAKVKKGGVGERFVEIKLKSGKSQALDYSITIFS